MRGKLWYRSQTLVMEIMAALSERVPSEMDLRELESICGLVRDRRGEGWAKKTIEETIRDLADFGAVRLLDAPSSDGRRGPRERVVRLTVLGAAWADQEEQLPLRFKDLRPLVEDLMYVAGESDG